MDLRSGHPFWLVKNGLLAAYPPITSDESCDVAVLGAGVTGALVAAALVREGVNVVVLDKRDVCTGSTVASTALLQYEIDTELLDLIEKVGEKHAVRSYRLGLETIAALESQVRALGDDCGFARRNSLYVASSRRDGKRLRAEYDCRAGHGFAVEFLDPADLAARFSFAGHGAILGTGDAECDAFRVAHGLLRQVRAAGGRVYDRTTASAVDRTPDGFLLKTDRGPGVSAKRVVFATGYESEQYLKSPATKLHSTFAAVSEPMDPFPAWPDRCLIWETERPYTYLRTTPDDRVIIGGGDVPFATAHRQDRLVERKVEQLMTRFGELFPDVKFEVAYTWAGTFAETPDGLPYIGRPPQWPDAYFALGYGGNGITMSAIAAKLIADDYLGRPNPDAALFRFDRGA